MIIWISTALAMAIHERQLAEHGGGSGIRDDDLLESALARPRQYHANGDPPPDLVDLAASLAFGLTRNHPFVDGNKRTTAVACETFLLLNDATLGADDLTLYPVYLGLAEGRLDEAEFATWLRAHVRTKTDDAVHEPRKAYRS